MPGWFSLARERASRDEIVRQRRRSGRPAGAGFSERSVGRAVFGGLCTRPPSRPGPEAPGFQAGEIARPIRLARVPRIHLVVWRLSEHRLEHPPSQAYWRRAVCSPAFIRHCGQSPCGASAGNWPPHCGQSFSSAIVSSPSPLSAEAGVLPVSTYY